MNRYGAEISTKVVLCTIAWTEAGREEAIARIEKGGIAQSSSFA